MYEKFETLLKKKMLLLIRYQKKQKYRQQHFRIGKMEEASPRPINLKLWQITLVFQSNISLSKRGEEGIHDRTIQTPVHSSRSSKSFKS